MNGIMFIFSDLLQLTGCDPWQAQCIETLTLLFVFAPIVAGLPLALVEMCIRDSTKGMNSTAA